MRITALNTTPIYSLPCVGVGPGGEERMRRELHVLSATVDALPEGLGALLVCSDLQFVDTDGVQADQRRLIGEAAAQELGLMAQMGLLPDPETTGVLLAGDLYVDPALHARGGLGDVMGVWRAFDDAFGWVAGVAGNHDAFNGRARRPPALRRGSMRMLDGDVVTMGGLRIGGVSGVIGDPDRPWRRTEGAYIEALMHVLEQEPDVVVLHESPRPIDPGHVGRGRATLTRAIVEHSSAARPPLVVSGHVGWDAPLDPTGSGPQLLNVEERLVLLTLEADAPSLTR